MGQAQQETIMVNVIGRREMSQRMNAEARAWEITVSFPEARPDEPGVVPTPCLMAVEAVLAEVAELLTPRITVTEAQNEAVDVFISALNLVLVMGESSEIAHTLIDKLKSRRERGYVHPAVDSVLTNLLRHMAKLPEEDLAMKLSSKILRERWLQMRSVPEFSITVPAYGDRFTHLDVEDDREGVYDGRD